MRQYWLGFAAFFFLSMPVRAVAQDRVGELFAGWEKAQKEIQSLVIEFTVENIDEFDARTKPLNGTFKLVRSPDGKLHATHKVLGDRPNERVHGLLSERSVYLLRDNEKTATKFTSNSVSEVMAFLTKYYMPFTILLDRTRALEACVIEVVKEDDWYTHLTLRRRDRKRKEWFEIIPDSARAVFLKKDSDTVPKDMPRLLEWSNGHSTMKYVIRTWRVNLADPPRIEEFRKPEDRQGWVVGGAPEVRMPPSVDAGSEKPKGPEKDPRK